jgi:hypothetical protein
MPMVPNLVTVSAVKTRMVMPDIPASNPAIQSAIDGAYLRVEAELDTRIEKLSNVDVFLLDKSKCGYVIPDGVFRLRLRRSLVRASPAMVIKYSSSLDFTSAETVPTTDYVCNAEKGYVFVDKDYEDAYLQVTYDSGCVDASEVPAWLKEAVLSYVPVLFNLGQPAKKKDQSLPNIKAASDHALSLLNQGWRMMGFSISPVFL